MNKDMNGEVMCIGPNGNCACFVGGLDFKNCKQGKDIKFCIPIAQEREFLDKVIDGLHIGYGLAALLARSDSGCKGAYEETMEFLKPLIEIARELRDKLPKDEYELEEKRMDKEKLREQLGDIITSQGPSYKTTLRDVLTVEELEEITDRVYGKLKEIADKIYEKIKKPS